ncbi:MAG TPA: class I SAM-dependent methyltransferase [Planctomycetota bacterium]|nr:class I SAM-dependent methyltransferase [Planctomycetota bacterium]
MSSPDYSSAEGDAYHAERHKEFLDNPLLTKAMSEFARLTYFADLKPGARVLEIGAGLGTNLLAIKVTAKVTAVEPSKFAREHCAKIGIDSLASLDDVPADARFDCVLLRHVIEHLQEPRKMLLDAKRFLAQNGKLIVALPIEPIKAPPNPRDIDHHLYSWTRQTIHNLLLDCGYKNVATRLNYRNGRKVLLPVYRMFGAKAYARALKTLGCLRGLCEIVAEARL